MRPNPSVRGCLPLLVVALLAGCNQAGDQPHYASFGAEITPTDAQDINEVMRTADAATEARPVKVEGTIGSVCQRSGCWLRLDVDGDDDVLVTFKDYAFFVPKDAAGNHVVLEGVLQPVERSVDELRHMAEDAGKSAEEIAAINEPELAYSIEASGVLIRAD